MKEVGKDDWDRVYNGCGQDEHFLRHKWFEIWAKNNNSIEYECYIDNDDRIAVFPHFFKKLGF